MEDKKLISDSLLEWTLASKTEFLELSADDSKELVALAKKKGVPLNDPDIALFRTTYAEIGKPNRNNVLLNRAPVEKGFPTLNYKQINLNHLGSGHVCGFIIDSKIVNNDIIVYGIFYKSLFKEDWKVIQKKFENRELFVSFEIYNRNPITGESVMKIDANGIKEINPIIFHGMGLLTTKPPACPNARVTKLLAEFIDEKVVEEAEKIIEDFKPDENLVYAEMSLPCLNCEKCQHKNKGGNNIMAEEVKKEEIGKILNEPIDPNLFVKADETLDEEKCEASLPKEVTTRVKELIKEGKKPGDAVKQAWKEFKDKGKEKASSTLRCTKCGYSEDYERPLDKCPKCLEPMATTNLNPEQNVPGQTVAPVEPVAATVEAPAPVVPAADATPVAPVAEVAPATTDVPAEQAHTQREGNQNWSCPECSFTMPLLAEGDKKVQEPLFCPACGKAYYANWDERPCECELNSESCLPNEEDLHNEEMDGIDDAKKIDYKSRQNLPDSDFAVVVKQGDKKIRKFIINDEAHVRNALARLAQSKPRETLKSLGVSVDSVKSKILARARKLGMTDLLNKYKETSSLEGEAILNLSNQVIDLVAKLDAKTKEVDTMKAELDTTKKTAEEVPILKAELEKKVKEQKKKEIEIAANDEKIEMGEIEVAANDELKKKQKKVDELAFGKK